MTAPIIEVEGLTKSYGRKRGIVDVSFEVGEGEVFGFLGSQRRRQDDDHPRPHGSAARGRRAARAVAGLDCWEQSTEVKRIVGYLPGEPRSTPT